MTQPPDPLDALFSSSPELPDAGFTERVMRRLPPPRPAVRPWILGAGGLLAAAVAAALLVPSAVDLGPALAGAPTGEGLAALLTLAALVATAAAVALAELRPPACPRSA